MQIYLKSKVFSYIWLTRLPIVSVSILVTLISFNYTCLHRYFIIVPLTCIIIAGYIQNDLFDVKIDCISAPSRPLPSGRVSIYEAKILYVVFVTIGLLCGMLLQNIKYVLYLCAVLTSFFLYTKYFKVNWILKNMFTALSSTTVVFVPLLFGEKLTNQVLLLGGMAFFFTLGREIYMDIRDYDGDKIIPNIKRPSRRTGLISSIFFLLVFVLIKEIYFFKPSIIRYFTYIAIAIVILMLFLNKKTKYWIGSEYMKATFIYDLLLIYINSR